MFNYGSGRVRQNGRIERKQTESRRCQILCQSGQDYQSGVCRSGLRSIRFWNLILFLELNLIFWKFIQQKHLSTLHIKASNVPLLGDNEWRRRKVRENPFQSRLQHRHWKTGQFRFNQCHSKSRLLRRRKGQITRSSTIYQGKFIINFIKNY